MLNAYRQCDEVPDRPSVVFAYTVKGWGLPIAGGPMNHSALLSVQQMERLRTQLGRSQKNEWDAFSTRSAAGKLCRERAKVLKRPLAPPPLEITVPDRIDTRANQRPVCTQETFGRLIVGLARDEGIAPYLVTTAPDVSISTNLAGWINKVGVFTSVDEPVWSGEEQLLRWKQHRGGQHIELGISEMNLFLLLGQLGLSWDLSGQPLIPIGTVYDPFVLRGLDAFLYSTYSGARFIVAGTPSGVTLAPEGGAHQSTITPSVGLELPGVTFMEPAYAGALDWLLCDALRAIVREDGGSAYLRLTTRSIDQSPFEVARARYGDEGLRRAVLEGGYQLVASDVDGPPVYLVASGAVMPEVLSAASELADEGVRAHVVDITSLDRLYVHWRQGSRDALRAARIPRASMPPFDSLFPERAPLVTIHDASSHAMAWLGSTIGMLCIPLGVDTFGESGRVQDDLYEAHDLSSGSIVNAGLGAIELARERGADVAWGNR